MIHYWSIPLLNVLFVLLLGMVTVWLLAVSILAGTVRRSSPQQRAELSLRVFRDDRPFLSIPLGKGHHRIGRGRECEILLKGPEIPVVAGEIYRQNGCILYRPFSYNNGEMETSEPSVVHPGDEIVCGNYRLRVEEQRAS